MHDGYTMRDAKFWGVIVSLGMASTYIFSVMYAFQPLLPILTNEFDISITYASLSMSAMTVGLILGLLVIGFLSDRYGREKFVKFSILFVALPFFILPSVQDFIWIVILRFLQGFMLAGVAAVALAYIGEEIHPKFRGMATALYISFNSVGGMIGRVITGTLTENHSWIFAIYVLAILGLITFIIVISLLPPSTNFRASQVTMTQDMKGLLIHLKNRRLVLLFMFGLILQVSFTSVWTYLPFYLQSSPYNWRLQDISLVYVTYGFGIVGAPLAGYLATKYGLVHIRTSGIVFLIIGILLTLVPTTIGIVLGMCVICLGFFVAHSSMATSVNMEAQHHKSGASSLYLVSYYIGVAIGSSAFGHVWVCKGWHGIITIAALTLILYSLFAMISSNLIKKAPYIK